MLGETVPGFVSCMCPTRGNPRFVERAIKNFIKQDYPHRELVFVSTNPNVRLPVDRPDIRMHRIELDGAAHMNIGQQRNICVELCQGEYIAVWDDDDFYAPDRLTYSIGEMERQKKPAFVLHSETLLAYSGNAFVHDSRLWENSFVSRKDALQEVGYPNVQIAEDLKMLTSFCRRWGRPAISMRHEMYVYVQQPDGTTNSDPHHVNAGTWNYNLSVSKRLDHDEQVRILTLCGAYE